MKTKITAIIIILLLVIAYLLYLNLNKNNPSKEVFQNKQECSQYSSTANTKIKESGRVFEKDTYTIKEVFYSPKLNTCLYAWILHTTFDPKEIYSIDDIFGGGIYTGGLAENAEQSFYEEIEKLKK
ncbi:MAG: hypothetical protein M3M85_02900 [bacterium]|nr:hypothetical protein [bacterium]